MTFEIVTTAKKNLKDEDAVRERLAKDRPGMRIEAIVDRGSSWWVRLAEGPPFPPKDEEAPSEDAPKDLEEATDEKSDDSDDDEKSDDDDKKGEDKKDDGEGDALGKLKELVGEMQSLFDELVNKGGEIAEDAKAKSDKIKEIHDTVKDDVSDSPAEVGPVPGGGPVPPMDGPPVPQGPKPAKGLDKRKKLPGGGGLSTFTNRRTFIATHDGVDNDGKRISMTAAARELEENEEWSAYEVVNIKAEGDKYVAKLQLREDQ
jgi:hypothetical protein